jgi:hypothetical protein
MPTPDKRELFEHSYEEALKKAKMPDPSVVEAMVADVLCDEDPNMMSSPELARFIKKELEEKNTPVNWFTGDIAGRIRSRLSEDDVMESIRSLRSFAKECQNRGSFAFGWKGGKEPPLEISRELCLMSLVIMLRETGLDGKLTVEEVENCTLDIEHLPDERLYAVKSVLTVRRGAKRETIGPCTFMVPQFDHLFRS